MFACKRLLTSLLALLLALTVAQAHAQGQRAQLTIIVRDTAGAPLAGVQVTLALDGDDGRKHIGQLATDQAGQVVYPELAYGIYVVAFTGSTPDGRPILPVEQQNLGLLDDGAGTPGGFGLRVVQPEVLQLFVLGSLAGEERAVPMFDLAPAPNVAPTPIDPQLAIAHPTPTAFTLDQAIAEQRGPGPASPRPEGDSRLLWLCLAVLVPALGIVLLGFWRSLSARRQAQTTAGSSQAPAHQEEEE